jgi:hypothetical protein
MRISLKKHRRPSACKSAQSVPYRPWPGLTASAGLLEFAEIRLVGVSHGCQPLGGRFASVPAAIIWSVVIYTRTRYLLISLLTCRDAWVAMSKVLDPPCAAMSVRVCI